MWFNKKIKGIIEEKNEFKAYCNNGTNTALDNCLRNLQVRLNSERKMKNFKVLSAKKNFFNKIVNYKFLMTLIKTLKHVGLS